MNKINQGNLAMPEYCLKLNPMTDVRRHCIQTRGQQVLTDTGLAMDVSELHPGTLLMGENSQPVPIKRVQRRCTPVYEIIPTKGHPFVIAWDQPLYLTHRESGLPLQLPVQEIAEMPFYRRRCFGIPRARFLHFPRVQELPLDPYFLGILIGRGCFTRKRVTVTTSEQEILTYLHSNHIRYPLRAYRQGDSVIYSFPQSSHVMRTLNELKLLNRKVDQKRIPSCYLRASYTDRLHLLAGLLDSSGTLDGSVYNFTTASWLLGLDIAELARSVGLGVFESEITLKQVVYARVYIYGDYRNLPLLVKRKQALNNRTNPHCEIFKIRSVGIKQATYIDTPEPYLMADLTIRKGDFL